MTSITRFAGHWASALAGATPAWGPVPDLAAGLHELAAEVVEAIRTGTVDPGVGRDIGVALIARGYRTVAAIGPTVQAVITSFADEDVHRVGSVAAWIATGVATAQRELLLAEQEDMHRAAVAAVRVAEAEQRISEARFRALFTHAAVGIGVVDAHGHVLDGNRTWAAMMGYSIDEMRGRPIQALVQAGSDPVAMVRLREVLGGLRDHFRLEFTHEDRHGRRLEMDLSVSRVTTSGGEPDFVVGIAIDITDRRRLQESLWHEARHDPLTLLPNRQLFFERLEEWLAQAGRGPVGLCYVDLDCFKSVNDSLGHEIGDQLLVRVAERLSAAVAGTGGLLARLGGDEFGVISRPADPGELGALAERILAGLAEPITLDGRELTVSASVGVVDTTTAGTATDMLMRAADISLYTAKARGRGRWESHDPLRDARQVTRHTLATEMAAALAHGEFLLEYQPLVSLQDGEVRRVEALVRWRHPRLGLLQTDDFITIAEDNDLIVPLGLSVLEDACRQADEWYRRFPDAHVGVNVNVSVRQLRDEGFADEVRAVLARTGLPPQLLHLELTESAVLGDAHGPLDVLGDIAAAGVRLAIDDFGTGYSNLSHLSRLPVSELKLAGSFLNVAPYGAQTNMKIIPAVISLAHSLGLTVTAEGVETAQQVNELRELSCDTAQGWFFARPGSAEEINRILTAAQASHTADGAAVALTATGR